MSTTLGKVINVSCSKQNTNFVSTRQLRGGRGVPKKFKLNKPNVNKPNKYKVEHSGVNDRKNTIECDNSLKKEDMRFDNWAPELINGRCAMLGYAAGYGYEGLKNKSFLEQIPNHYGEFVFLVLAVTYMTLETGKPTKEDVKVNGLTPEAELFNGRAAMIGIASTLVYELMTKYM